MAASCARDGTVAVLKMPDIGKARLFASPGSPARVVALSPDGTMVASGHEDGRLVVRIIAAGEPRETRLPGSINSVSFSPDGATVLTSTESGKVLLYDARGLTLARAFEGEGSAFQQGAGMAAFSPDGRTVAASSLRGDTQITLWDTGTGRITDQIKLIVTPSNTLFFLPDGSGFATPAGTRAFLWDLDTGRARRVLSSDRWFDSAVPVGDGSAIAQFSGNKKGGSISFVDATTGHVEKKIAIQTRFVSRTAMSRDGTHLVGGSEDGQLIVVDVPGRRLLTTIKAHPRKIAAVGVSSDGRLIASSDVNADGLKIWDSATGKLLKTIIDYNATSIAFSADDRTIFTSSWTTPTGLDAWDVRTGRMLASFSLKIPEDAQSGATAICVSPDGTRLATSSYSPAGGIGFGLWDIARRRLVWKTPASGMSTNSMAFSPDGRRIVATTESGYSVVLDAESGRTLATTYAFMDGEWVSVAPGGWFNASENGARMLNVRQGGRVLGIDNFFETYYRPDIVEASLAGRDISGLTAGKSMVAGFKTPPAVVLEVARTDGSFRGLARVTAEAPPAIHDGELDVRVRASDAGGGVSRLRLTLNGKMAGETGASEKPVKGVLEKVFTVSLASGENVLQATAFSSDLTESDPVELRFSWTTATVNKPRLLFLGVGVDKYLNPKYDLNFATGDVKGFKEALTAHASRLFDSVQAVLIFDEAATRAGVIAAMQQVAEISRNEDVFVFFYAGHGIALDADSSSPSDFAFVLTEMTQMADPGKVRAAGISGTEFRDLAAKVKAQKQVLLIDACNAGALAEAFARRGAAEEIALRKLSRSTGAALIAASKADQFAQEFVTLGHGAFTQALIDGINGRAATAAG